MVGITCGLYGRRVDLRMVRQVVCEWVDLHIVWWVGELVGSLLVRLTCGLPGFELTCWWTGGWHDLQSTWWEG